MSNSNMSGTFCRNFTVRPIDIRVKPYFDDIYEEYVYEEPSDGSSMERKSNLEDSAEKRAVRKMNFRDRQTLEESCEILSKTISGLGERGALQILSHLGVYLLHAK